MAFVEFTKDEPGHAGEAARWYLAYTRPRMEEAAALNLERQGFSTYLPLYKTCAWGENGAKAAYEPLFPRYVFFSPAHAGHSLTPVRSTRGVHSIVGFGGAVAEVPPGVLEQVRRCEQERTKIPLDALNPVRAGARVRLRKGALQGLDGLVLSVARDRVTFLLRLLGREKTVTVPCAEVMPA